MVLKRFFSVQGTVAVAAVAVVLLASLALGSKAQAGPFASEFRECDPPPANSSIEAVAKWVAKTAPLGELAQRAFEEKTDVRTPFGTVIAGSCLTGLGEGNAGLANARIKRITRALAFTFAQSYRCEKALGLPNIGAAMGVLTHSRVTCDELDDKNTMAKAQVYDWRPGVAMLTATKRAFDRKYAINIPLRWLDNVDKLSDEALASNLLHEGLHNTTSNNRLWHNEWVGIGRQDSPSCEHSVYEDRIYFTEAACFPKEHDSWTLAVKTCPGLCEAALSEVEVEKDYKVATGSGSIFGISSGTIGPELNAIPLGKSEADLVCNRIRSTFNVQGSYHQAVDQAHVMAYEQANRIFKVNVLPKNTRNADSVRFRATLREFAKWSQSVKDINDYDESEKPLRDIVRNLNRLEALLMRQIAEACAKQPVSVDWSDLCFVKGSPVLHGLKAARLPVDQLVQSLDTSAGEGLGSQREILEYFRESH